MPALRPMPKSRPFEFGEGAVGAQVSGMTDSVPESTARTSLAYRLGRASAPHSSRLRWMWKSLAGSPEEQLAAEQAVGVHLLAAYRQQAPIDDDPGVNRRLDRVHKQLLEGIAVRRRTFRVEGSLEPEANACALPGGIVLVTRPLLERCQDDDDALAFVIAHEMGHIVRRHAADRYLVSGVVKAVCQVMPGRTPLTQILRDQLHTLLTQGYSRDQEFEADAYGVRLARAAGFSGDGAIRLLGLLDPGTEDLFPYLRSHPPLPDRIRAIQTLSEAGHSR